VKEVRCPKCGEAVKCYRNPFPTVDIIIEVLAQGASEGPSKERQGIVLIQRKNPPYGWALPGGFVDYGESLEQAAVREAREETSLAVSLKGQLGAYSAPDRDPRQHTISVVFVAEARGRPVAADDAQEARVFSRNELPEEMAFDHRQILEDYFTTRAQFKKSDA
jgi:ADP-ribose pyrophosphatase YjhB (NUDIX family)